MDGIGGYSFVREIGRGVHGRVFLATAPPRLSADEAQVAVKVFSTDAAEDGFAAMVEELRTFADLASPRLIRLYDAGLEGRTAFCTMRFEPLGSLGSPKREVSRRDRVLAVARAAQAAHELHEAGLAHRGIRPANILIASTGAVLSEPAVAQLLSRGEHLTGLGTRGDARDLEFVDPALMRGATPGRPSDIWALGVTLHIALTGFGLYPALTSADPMVAARMFLRTRPEPDAGLSGRERAVVGRAIHPDARERYPTAASLADDIDGLVA
ncbi:MAG TPA: protein kinase [Pedococcus sp.]|jgi:serine/threonine-protein kinase|nr:protein kinase [Pedococcus sp.]